MHPQPLIAVHDVAANSRWYQSLLGCESGHGGLEYEQLVCDGRMVMQPEHTETGVLSQRPAMSIRHPPAAMPTSAHTGH